MDNNDDRKCKECGRTFDTSEGVRRHIRSHSMTCKQYWLKWFYDGVIPKCACGCEEDVSWNVLMKDFSTYVHGHHAKGRVKSEEEKRKIGDANRLNMTKYYEEHPEVAKLRSEQMRAGTTPESEQRRIETLHQTYAEMSVEEKQAFSDRMHRRWDSGEMKEAKEKAGATYHRNFVAGLYDFEDRNKRISEVIAQKYVDGDWQFSKGFHESVKTGKRHYFRSSWELQFMLSLDDDPGVTDWESEFMRIPYEWEGATHQYVPDFHVVRGDVHQLVEVKPLALRSFGRNVPKRESALVFCQEHGWEYLEWSPEVS